MAKNKDVPVMLGDYTPPARFDDINMSAKGLPASPDPASLKRGYTPLPCGDVQSKTETEQFFNELDDSSMVDGFVPRNNRNERL